MKLVLTLLILVLSINLVNAQSQGNLKVIKEARIDTLLKKHKQFLEKRKGVPGFRIQIYSGLQRTKANEMKILFHEKYPSVGVYLSYQQPNFRVRIGDFNTRIDAYRFQKQIEKEFESFFIVKDLIKP